MEKENGDDFFAGAGVEAATGADAFFEGREFGSRGKADGRNVGPLYLENDKLGRPIDI